ncbi:DHH family phosphoesterase [Lactiplantibacillus daowaiensis]|uniref:Bifunctional oligoribonuclease/PAP phosphatase NrnA n=1 Tax=Lactiplantibacillus daowaiensis TaxID=2559918 RepID=A0ABW1S361_9LACO|nr:bifunctional oligoribonuclease/PAP phosphatase NrnA [Lactiplantibacillus daowaiensis]
MLTEILALIEQHQQIYVYRHQNPDPDAIGSQFGLVQLLKTSFPAKQIYAGGTPSQALAWLGDASVQTLQTPTAADLIIIVDCANPSRIDGPVPPQVPVIKIDHHPNRQPYGTLNWVDPSYSSCAEMIYTVYQAHHQQLTLTAAAATHLYAGILGDTVQFSTPETSARTLNIAAKLAALGVNVSQVSHQETDLTPKISKLAGYVLSELVVDAHGVGVLTLTQRTLQQLGLRLDEVDAVVALPGRLTNVQAWLWFIEHPDGTYRVHLRSKQRPIDGVAQRFGGGGHPLASGTYVQNMTIGQQLIERVQEIF